jgi:hypothetical protein
MKALYSVETSGTTQPTTQHHIPKDSIFSLLEVEYFWTRWMTVSFSGRFTVSNNRHSVTPL